MKKVLMSLLLGSLVLVPHLAHATTYFYADPDFSGTRNGSASNPWQSLSDSGAWTAINNALASGDVTVYFSAREASSDTDEQWSTNVTIQRNTSSHRLTLDGMSKYNTNDSSPSWVDYTGNSRFRINSSPGGSRSAALYWGDQSYLTLRGLKLRGQGNSDHVFRGSGSHVIIEYCEWYGDTTGGSGGLFEYAVQRNKSYEDITFRYNKIHDTRKEGLYIGGMQDEAGYAHRYIYIHDNEIWNVSGDGIDLKPGLRNVEIRDNVIHDNNGTGIVSHSAYLAERNTVYDNGSQGISVSNYWGYQADCFVGTVWRNNIVWGNGNNNINIDHTGGHPTIRNIRIYNNTAFNAGASNIYIESGIEDVYIQNNICYLGAINVNAGGTRVIDHNHTGDPGFVNAAGGDFSLREGSPCLDAGVALSGFAEDFRGAPRPYGSAWDIGAYEYGTAGLPGPPAAPTGLEVYPE